MLILLSPAKTLDFEKPAPVQQHTDLIFPDQAEYLAGKLKKLKPARIKRMMGISENLAQLNAERFQSWSLPFNENNAKQALFAFQGDVYIGLQADTFSKADVDFAQDHVRILSGLYGLLRPLDLMQPYRLEMGTDWAVTPKTKNLSGFWKKKLTAKLKEELKAMDHPFVANLASQEYAKAVDLKSLGAKVITPEFKEEREGKFQMIGFFAKKARGMMTAYAVKHRISNPEDLKGFDMEEYGFNERLSDNSKYKWVFTRKPN
jgi:cytoplasmic iron level regulating protein YaaA (DUF328/UPF0246 family)